jgi:pimeloyl-ACP methyl ester carboxylesterase
MQSGSGDSGICLVTIHGIGFQQAPDDANDVAGYADPLHEALRGRLGSLLSDDPNRAQPPHAPGKQGVIYVESSWPTQIDPTRRSVEEGLRRLGPSTAADAPSLDLSKARLYDGVGRIAHVALIYTALEETGPDRMAGLETAASALIRASHYSSLLGALETAGGDLATIIHEPPVAGPSVGGNVPRSDLPRHEGIMRKAFDFLERKTADADQSGPLEVLRTVEDDVAAYVVRDSRREPVWAFAQEALIRLAQREDVLRIVVNAHSQGSVVAFDALRTLPDAAMTKVAALITMGSPLRKMVETLSWGRDVGQIRHLGGWDATRPGSSAGSLWTNLWDQRDPVADPLDPCLTWQRGDDITPTTCVGMLVDIDPWSGEETAHRIEDHQVSNVDNVNTGGLRAHDYWDNSAQVVPWIEQRLRDALPPGS